jgi:hypothetical protein
VPDSDPRLLARLARAVRRRLGAGGHAAREAASERRTAARGAAREADTADRAQREHERTVADLRAQARHADEQLALYRRRTYLGRGEPRRLAELERIAHGAAERLRRAEQA